MLIQCDYKVDDEFLVKNQTIYYQGVKISPANPQPIWTVGECELYLFSAVFPLKCAWLAVIQSRFPVFYECEKVELKAEKIVLYLTNGRSLSVRPFRDGVRDRFLLGDVYTI